MSKTSAIVKRQKKIVNRKKFGRLARARWSPQRRATPASADSGANTVNADEFIERNPEKMGGVAVFTGTRVPVEYLFQFLEDDQTVETFLDQYPSVSRAQARGVLGASRDLLLGS